MTDDLSHPPLSFLGWLSLFYLLLPHILFGVGWLAPAIMVLYVTVMAAVLWRAGRLAVAEWPANRAYWAPRARAWWPAILLAIAWVAISGAGGVGYQNGDYVAANSLLKDLITRAWPLRYEHPAGPSSTPVYLVYYVAYYLPAAAVGKAAGWIAANTALFLWTCLGVLLALGWIAMLARIPVTAWSGLSVVFLFSAFSGMDWLGLWYRGESSRLGEHVEWWAGVFQYSSHTTLLFWVPQHALAPWIVTGALIGAARFPSEFERYALILPSACLLWSPFATVGLIPIAATVALLAWRRGTLHRLISAGTLAAAGIIGAVTVPFFLANRFAFPKGFIFTMASDTFGLSSDISIERLLVFWMVEFAVLVLLLLYERGVPQGLRAWLWLALACLLVIPLYKTGLNNEFAMRTSIPGLFVISLAAIAMLFTKDVRRSQRVAVLIVLAVGSLTALSEVARAIASYHFGPPPLSEVESFPRLLPRDVAQRSGAPDAVFFRYLGRP